MSDTDTGVVFDPVTNYEITIDTEGLARDSAGVTIEVETVDAVLEVNVGERGPEGPSGPQGPTGSTGPQGPQGPAGLLLDENGAVIVASSYTHTQQMPSASWVINHNLGFVPAVTVTDTQGSTGTGDVQIVDLNTVVVSFAYPFAGTAYVS